MLRILVEKHKGRVKSFLEVIGYDYRNRTRPVVYRECFEKVKSWGPEQLDVLEISAGEHWQTLRFRSFTEANYFEFDICKDKLDRQFDVIIADQVFEHLLWPARAARNVHSMLKPGGRFAITSPFLIKASDVQTAVVLNGYSLIQ